jgi:MFS family permease
MGTGFFIGALFGTLGGLLAAFAIWRGSLALLCVGTLLVGAYQAFAQFYRFAAAEVADDAWKSRAISLVLAGGIVAAVLGPLLGRWGGPLLEPAYVGSFLLLAVVSLIAAALLTGLRMPPAPPPTTTESAVRPLMAIMRQPRYLAALFGAATGYGVMILAMTATPIAMVHHHHPLSHATLVIQLHVLGMFVPSFFTGSLIARYGVLRIMLAGIALLAGHVLMSLTGTSLHSFAGALILLGVGWNFLYIGGTTLLTGTYTAAERGRAQAANDLTVFVVGLLASLGAGALLEVAGWRTLNLLLLPWLATAAAVLVGLSWRRRTSAERHTETAAAS